MNYLLKKCNKVNPFVKKPTPACNNAEHISKIPVMAYQEQFEGPNWMTKKFSSGHHTDNTETISDVDFRSGHHTDNTETISDVDFRSGHHTDNTETISDVDFRTRSKYSIYSVTTLCLLSTVGVVAVVSYDLLTSITSVCQMNIIGQKLQDCFDDLLMFVEIMHAHVKYFIQSASHNFTDLAILDDASLWIKKEVSYVCEQFPKNYHNYCQSLVSLQYLCLYQIFVEKRTNVKLNTSRIAQRNIFCFTQYKLYHLTAYVPLSIFVMTLQLLIQCKLSCYAVNCSTPITLNSSLFSPANNVFTKQYDLSCHSSLRRVVIAGDFSGASLCEVIDVNFRKNEFVDIPCEDYEGDKEDISIKLMMEVFQQWFERVLFQIQTMQVQSTQEIRNQIGDKTRQTVFYSGVIIISIVTGIGIFRHVNNLSYFTWRYAKCLEKRTEELNEEKDKTNQLLYRMLPKMIADKLKTHSPVTAESYECVSIYFSDIVGFTTICSGSTPMQVVEILNSLYSTYDCRIDTYDVYKVETIGDAYMVASGVPHRNGRKHASEIATMAIDLMSAVKQVKMPAHVESCGHLQVRIGLHSGPCVAGIVGHKMPRYCLFGDTVNVASRMESSSEPMKIHISKAMKLLLDDSNIYTFESRGQICVKGKGQMETYWLIGRTDMAESNDSMVCMFKPKKRFNK